MASSSLLPRLVLGAAIILTVAAGGKNYLNTGKIDEARDMAKVAEGKVSAAEETAKTAAKTASDAVAKLKAVEDAKTAAEAKSSSSVAEIEKAKKEAEEAAAQVTAKETEITDLKKKLEDAGVPQQPAVPAVDPVKEKELADAKAQIAENEQLLKTAMSKSEDADKKAAALEQENARRLAGLNKPGLEGKVLAVNPNWSFVVLNIGDKQGVVAGSSLIVKRGNSMVAKLRVTSVEPSTSIADIQAGTAAKGNTVQPGDVVIFPGS